MRTAQNPDHKSRLLQRIGMKESRSHKDDEAADSFSPVIRDSGLAQKTDQPLRGKKPSGVSIDLESLTKCESNQKSSIKRSELGQSAKNMSKKSVAPVAWNRSEVSGLSEAGIARGGMRSESKVTSMRSSLFRKKIPGPAPHEDDAAEEEDAPENSPEAKKKKEESIMKRMAALDVALGV